MWSQFRHTGTCSLLLSNLWRKLLSTSGAGRSYGLGWGHTVWWGVGSTLCATAYSEPLALNEGGFFFCLSVFHRNPSWQDFLVYFHPNTQSAWILPTFLLGPSPVSNRVRNLLAWRPLDQIQSMLIWPRRKNDPLEIISSKCTFYLLLSGTHQGQLQKEILLILGQKWEAVLVGFRWRLVLQSHELIRVLTIKQAFLQFR